MKKVLTILVATLLSCSFAFGQTQPLKRIKVIIRGYVVLDTLVNPIEDLTILDLSSQPVSNPQTGATTDLPILPTEHNYNNSPKATTSSNKTNRSQISSSNYTSTQCAATTKKGRRCSRNAKAGSRYCWQHQ